MIRDILHRLEDRFPCRVLLWPTPVQGEGAAEKVAAAIQGLNALAAPPDLLIVARGGGSIEDLWAFNEEVVVRAIAGSAIPVISAVGHETDTSLADFAADRRAPTPTAAAELAMPVRAELAALVQGLATARPLRAADAGARPGAARRVAAPLAGARGLARAAAAEGWTSSPNGCRARCAAGSIRRGANWAPRRARCGRACSRRGVARAEERLAALWRMAELAHPDRPLRKGYARVEDRAGQRSLRPRARVGAAFPPGLP